MNSFSHRKKKIERILLYEWYFKIHLAGHDNNEQWNWQVHKTTTCSLVGQDIQILLSDQ